jgi:hypothetical protein
MISFSSFPMKMLAYEGAIFVPIAVPLICKKCSPLNVKLLCFSTNVSNWTRHIYIYIQQDIYIYYSISPSI